MDSRYDNISQGNKENTTTTSMYTSRRKMASNTSAAMDKQFTMADDDIVFYNESL